ncbi:MAG: hypothetical protein Q7R49_07025 [Candidatus Daviesbacteria bacterium]|nr:hypothetical protein [Candidatus Daviesbacteria bacterium]
MVRVVLKNNPTLILIIILIIVVPVLAYKSTDLQKLFNNLPIQSKEVRIEMSKSATSSAELKKPLTCPSIKDFCTKGADVTFNGNYAGFGGTLSKGSPVYAMFDGEATVSTTDLPQYNNEQIISVSLQNTTKGWLVTYIYRGDVPTKTSFKTGEKISIVSGEVMSAYKVSLLVQLMTDNSAGGEIVHLTPKDFSF